MGRFYHCARKYEFKNIVRLTADNPFTDIEELGRLIDLHIEEKNDYTHSFGQLPVGVGAEIFTFNALKRSFFEGNEANHREHVNEYIQENINGFIINQLKVSENKSNPSLRLTIDTEEDYELACSLVENSGSENMVTTEGAIKFCSRYV